MYTFIQRPILSPAIIYHAVSAAVAGGGQPEDKKDCPTKNRRSSVHECHQIHSLHLPFQTYPFMPPSISTTHPGLAYLLCSSGSKMATSGMFHMSKLAATLQQQDSIPLPQIKYHLCLLQPHTSFHLSFSPAHSFTLSPSPTFKSSTCS